MQSERPAMTTAWVRATMQAIYKKEITKKQIGTKKVVKTKGIFNKTSFDAEEPIYEHEETWVATGKYSDTQIDIEEFSKRINKMCQELTASGYKVIQIIPINSGRYKYEFKEVGSTQRILGNTEAITGGGYGYGYGYGITDGVIIVGELKTE